MNKNEARHLGQDAGQDAAQLWFYENMTDIDARAILSDDDPTGIYKFEKYTPPRWNTGEWNHGPTPHNTEMTNSETEAYEEAADDAYWIELYRLADAYLKTPKGS